MLRFTSPVTVRLEPGGLLSWRRQAGARVRVLSGSAWVTQANDLEDHFLQPGQTIALRAGALIGAEQHVSLRFETDRAFDARALWHWLNGVAGRVAMRSVSTVRA
ncbi:MAG: DUF2917 domain-containing protein [Burkholderiales bacterium]